MKIIIFIFVIIFSNLATAENWMRISEIAAPLSTVYVAKSDCEKSGQSCVKIDGVDLEIVDFVGGSFVINQAKLDAKNARLAQVQANDAAVAAAQARLDAIDISTVTTIAGLKAVVQDLIVLKKGKP